MKLYTNPISPFCRFAAIYLDEKSVEHETVEITSGADRASLLAVNPLGEVPALATDHRVIAGASAICDFLDLRRPEPALLPDDPDERVTCRNLEAIAHSTTDALQFLVHLVSFRRPELAAEVPGLRERLTDAVRDHYAFLEAKLDAGGFLAGDYSRADVALFTMVSSLVSMDHPIDSGPESLSAWFARVASRPAVRRDARRALGSEAAQAVGDDPFFRSDRIHWRSHRVEWACRLGLAEWLGQEIRSGRAFFSPAPRVRAPGEAV